MKKSWTSFMDRRVKERLVGAMILALLVVVVVPELLSGPKRLAAPTSPAGAAEAVRNVTVDLATRKATSAPDTPAAVSSSVPSTGSPDGGGQAAAADATQDPARDSTGDSATDLSGGPAPAPPITNEPANGAPMHRAAPPTITTLQAQQPTNVGADGSPPATTAASKPGGPRPSGPAPPLAGTHHAWALQVGSFVSRPNAARLDHQLRMEGFTSYVSASGAGKALRYRVRVGGLADRAAADKMASKLNRAGHPSSVIAP